MCRSKGTDLEMLDYEWRETPRWRDMYAEEENMIIAQVPQMGEG